MIFLSKDFGKIFIVIYWLGGKICIMKMEKWIVFSESLYFNSNPLQYMMIADHDI